MAVQRSTAARNAMLDALEVAIGTSARLQIRTGSPPASCAAANTGALIVEFALPADWATNAANGAKAFAAVADVTAVASGTMGHYRLFASDGTTCHEQGTIGLAASSPDMVVDNPGVLAGQRIGLTGWTITAPGS